MFVILRRNKNKNYSKSYSNKYTGRRSKLLVLMRLSVFIIFTAITQIGGIIYLLSWLITRKLESKKLLFQSMLFLSLYLIATYLVVPKLAPLFGREKITNTHFVEPHSIFYTLCNRNYVTPELNLVLQRIGEKLNKRNEGIKLVYLDANFPFINGFPLLPHRYHIDGKKIDITFVYEEDKLITNKKPSFSGYGIFEKPLASEWNQINACLETGYNQYDFTKFVTFGNIHPNLTFSADENKYFLLDFLNQENVETIFIEPHLKTRLGLENDKFEYHGCGTVRHDDHIHIEVK